MDGPALPVAGTRWPETATVTVVRGQGPRAEGLVRPRSWGLLVNPAPRGIVGAPSYPQIIYSHSVVWGGETCRALVQFVRMDFHLIVLIKFRGRAYWLNSVLCGRLFIKFRNTTEHKCPIKYISVGSVD